ncbi:ANK_REP_REGION domain-containing protein [Trichonephila inaurata madagascariensis]|uniref:ANK_REP_REGION domain-containing protein n=1 Tax=Trichonephila inaurata madagascariensis TaxID=2747483 RepID=A0A8X6Y5Y8_9ARAC|nr:ANK_REP_REGION domain-containing protein [Trichonephila inaurata madagascariensis]
MVYSGDDIRELCLDADKGLMYDNKDNKVTSLEDLQNRLKRKAKFKEIDFQSKCEGDNSLGDLLLKRATENGYPRVKDFLIEKGFNFPQQEQVATAINEEEEAPNVEENKSDSNKVDSSNCKNPGMTAEVLYKQLIQGRETNRAIFDSFANAVRESNITGDRGVFLDVVKLFTGLDDVIHLTDTASRTILGIAAITKQADVVRILLDSGKFNEEEKFNALRSAIVQGNVQEVEAFSGYVDDKSRQAALELAMNNAQKEITQVLLNFITQETPNVEENRAKPCSSNENIGNKPTATVPSILTKKTNPIAVPNSGNGGDKPVSPVVSTNAGTPAMSSGNDKSSNLTNAQFSRPNEKETKYKENFYASLTKDVVGVVITGLFIAAAVMVPFAAGAVICGVIAALVAVCTGLHIKNSTLPGYKEMEKNKVEHVSSKTAQTL